MIISPRSRYIFPDISHYDPFLNPSEYVAANIKFTILRIGSGDAGIDPSFITNASKLIDAGIIIMGYWYIDPTGEAAAQAKTCKQIIETSGLPIKYVWGDIERWWTDWAWYDLFKHGKVPFDFSKVFPSNFLNIYYKGFMAELAGQFPDRIGIYTGKGFITSWCQQMAGWLFSYPLWIAQYHKEVTKGTFLTWEQFNAAWLPTDDPDMKEMSKEFPLQLVGQQFTGDHVRLPGAYNNALMRTKDATPLDVNIFRKEFCDKLSDGGDISVIGPARDGTIPVALFQAIVMTSSANIRNAPVDTASIIREEPQGKILSIYRISTAGWGKVSPVDEEWVFMTDLRKAPRARKERGARRNASS